MNEGKIVVVGHINLILALLYVFLVDFENQGNFNFLNEKLNL